MTTEAPQIIQETRHHVIKTIGVPQSGDGYDLAVEPPKGKQYPIHYYGKDMADVEGLKPGDAITMVVQRGRLKQGRDGRFPDHYYWDVVSITKGGQSEQAQQQGPQPAQSTTAPVMDKDTSIQRQVAVKEATQLVLEVYREWASSDGSIILSDFLDIRLPVLLQAVRRGAGTLYASISGRTEESE